MNFVTRIFAVFACLAALPLRAEVPPLLADAVHKWESGAEEWAFTQRVRTYENDKVKLERLERYDPSRPDNQRWELLEIDGKPPTPEQRAYWQDRKNRKPHKKTEKTLDDYFDFDHASITEETPKLVRYDVPLRKEATRFIPLEKFTIQLTVNKTSHCIEHVTAGLKEPFKVALGLAKVTDVDLDVRFDTIVRDFCPADGPGQPSGEAHVVLFKMGDRAEYAWTDFKRVTPANANRTSGREKS
jgi:hypothetical protein